MLKLDQVVIDNDGFELRADFAVQVGKKVAIIGPSGAGKSTLVAHLMATIDPARLTVAVLAGGAAASAILALLGLVLLALGFVHPRHGPLPAAGVRDQPGQFLQPAPGPGVGDARGVDLRDAGDPVESAKAYPALGERGREYFVRAGARLIDELGLTDEQVRALVGQEVQSLQTQSAAASDPAAFVDSIMQPCLVSLEASGL